METSPVADFTNYDSISQQPPFENMDQLYLQQQQQQKENENLLKHFASVISQGYDLNNNLVTEANNNQFDSKENFEIVKKTQNNTLINQQKAEEKVKDQDARVVIRKSVPEVEHPFSIANENLGNDYGKYIEWIKTKKINKKNSFFFLKLYCFLLKP